MSKETQWRSLRSLGIPELGCAAIMGNAQAESGCETNRLQGDFEITRSASRAYTKLVDDGAISREEFVHRGPCGGGYGWLQWTFPARKEGLYDTAKKLGVSIGSEEAAVSWFWEEIHQAEFSRVLNAILHGTSLREISDVFLTVYERPADMGEGVRINRARMAQEFLEQFGCGDPELQPEQDAETTAIVRVLQACMCQNSFWPANQIDGVKSAEFRKAFVEYANAVAKS